MSQIERSIIITYRWWCENKEEISEEHLELLDSHANKHINLQQTFGYTSGNLIFEVDNISYSIRLKQ